MGNRFPSRIRVDLPEQFDPALRQELDQLLRTPSGPGCALVILLSLSRLGLQLMRIVYAKAGHAAPSDNLFDCLAKAGRGEADQKIKGLKIVPDEILTGLHTVRMLSNKADHAAEAIALTEADAQNALGLFLRAVDWFYYEADFGPRLPRAHRRSSNRRFVFFSLVAVALVCALFFVDWRGFFHSPSSFPTLKAATMPAPVSLPDWVKGLPAAPVLQLLAESSPPAPSGDYQRPRFAFDLQGRRPDRPGKPFAPIHDGAELASGDQYLLIVRPQTPGFLYLFQIDARGNVDWFWPRNSTCSFSAGSNPVAAGDMLQLPPRERGTALFLDKNTGLEHVIAVFSAERWLELEEALETTRRTAPTTALVRGNLFQTRGEDDDTRGAGGEQTIEVEIKHERSPIKLVAPEQAASSCFIVVNRWFHHVDPRNSDPNQQRDSP